MTTNPNIFNITKTNKFLEMNNLSLGQAEHYIHTGTGIYLIPGSTGFPATQVPYVMALIFWQF